MKLSVVIPVYNEAATIGALLDRVFAVALDAPLEVVVVDDGSDPGTAGALAAARSKHDFRLVTLPETRGKGNALRAGVAECTGDVVLFQDADLEYDPADYSALLAPLTSGTADVVFGSRFLASAPAMAPHFRLANRGLTRLSNLLTGLRLTDMETGYKVFKRDVLRRLVLVEDGFGVEPEITAKLARLARSAPLRIVEVPVRYHARGYRDGKKIGVADGVRSLWCIARYNLLER